MQMELAGAPAVKRLERDFGGREERKVRDHG